MPTEFTKQRLQRLTHQLCGDLDCADVIYRQRNRVVVRVPSTDHGTVIIKMYAGPGYKSWCKRLLRMGSCDYEWWALGAMKSIGVRVPERLGHCHIPANGHGFTDAIAMEDLGETLPGSKYLKVLLEEGRESERGNFDRHLLDLTHKIVTNGYVDMDSGLINSRVRQSGEWCRLDLEMIRRVRFPVSAWHAYGKMYGRLMASYFNSAQPSLAVMESFAERLQERVRPSARIWRIADQVMRRDIVKRCNQSESHSGLVLPEIGGALQRRTTVPTQEKPQTDRSGTGKHSESSSLATARAMTR